MPKEISLDIIVKKKIKKSNRLSKKLIHLMAYDFVVSKPVDVVSMELSINKNTVDRYFKIFREEIFYNQLKEKIKRFGENDLDIFYRGSQERRGVQIPQKREVDEWINPLIGVFRDGENVYTEIVQESIRDDYQNQFQSVDFEKNNLRPYDGLIDLETGEISILKSDEDDVIEDFWTEYRNLLLNHRYRSYFELHLKEFECRNNYRNDSKNDGLTRKLLNILRKKDII